jgi:hypothetical protein
VESGVESGVELEAEIEAEIEAESGTQPRTAVHGKTYRPCEDKPVRHLHIYIWI